MTHSRIWLGAALACGALTLWSCSGQRLGAPGSGSGGAGGGADAGGQSPGGSGSGSGGVGGSSNTGTGGGCNSIDYPGPVLNVFDAQTGTPICDPTFTIVVEADGGLMFDDALASPCTPQPYFCPVSYDGGATPCPFYLAGLGYNTSGATIEVSAPGYEHLDVPGVAAGRSGCIPPFFPASHLNVNLPPLALDAGGTD